MVNGNVETIAQPRAPPAPLTTTDALDYLDKVKDTFKDTPRTYHRFLDIMKSFKNGRLKTSDVIQQVCTLFGGYPDLITGFNTFLPPGYLIKPASASDRINVAMPTDGREVMSGSGRKRKSVAVE
ncbi:paired amphipathic helix [Hysterangium stoloniferum]|nr:paired amphipathic helix [Hysterangium stoloniferum]